MVGIIAFFVLLSLYFAIVYRDKAEAFMYYVETYFLEYIFVIVRIYVAIFILVKLELDPASLREKRKRRRERLTQDRYK